MKNLNVGDNIGIDKVELITPGVIGIWTEGGKDNYIYDLNGQHCIVVNENGNVVKILE